MDSPSPSLKEIAFGDLERELAVTRTVLERLPPEHYGWKAHEKSMNLGQLALHIAELPNWIYVTIAQDELDASQAPRTPAELKERAELLARFDGHVTKMHDAVEHFDIANWNQPWTMRHGQEVIVTKPRSMVYRVWCLNHLIHHRAQLCVYLRLLNVPVPTVYFNTADNPAMVFD